MESSKFEIIVKTFIVTILFIVALFMLCGCSLFPANEINTEPTSVLTKVVTEHNWIVTVSILGIALSVMAFVNGNRYASIVFIGSCTALGTTLAVIKYANVIAIASLVAAVVVFVTTVLNKNNAIRDLIWGIEKVKAVEYPYQRKQVNKTLKKSQVKGTIAIVNKVKKGHLI